MQVNRTIMRESSILGSLLVLLAILAFVQSSHGVTFSYWVEDIFIPLQGAVHLHQGHLPSRDFGTPVGLFFYAPFWLVSTIMPLSARTIVWANFFVASVTAVLGFLIARRRMPVVIATLVTLFIALTAASPRQPGASLTAITYNAAYNRWSWAILCVFALLVGLRGCSESATSHRRSACVTGILLVILFFLKMPAFMVAVGLLIVALATVRASGRWQYLLLTLVVLILGLGLIEISTGLVEPYLSDLKRAAVATPLRPRIMQAQHLVLFCVPAATAVLLLFALAAPWTSNTKTGVAIGAMAFVAIGAGVAFGVNNYEALENPLIPIAGLIAWYGRRAGASLEDRACHLPSHLQRLFGVTSVLALLLLPVAQDIGATVYAGTVQPEIVPDVAWLGTSTMHDLRVREGSVDVRQMKVWGEGAALMRRHLGQRRDATVMSLAWVNPFAVLLGTRAPRHELSWWDPGRTFSTNNKPPAEMLFADVDYVLIPSYDTNLQATLLMTEIYGGYLSKNFRKVDRGINWSLYARRDCQRRALC